MTSQRADQRLPRKALNRPSAPRHLQLSKRLCPVPVGLLLSCSYKILNQRRGLMKIVTMIARYLLGLMFLVFGSNMLYPFIPMGPMPTGLAGQFSTVLFA